MRNIANIRLKHLQDVVRSFLHSVCTGCLLLMLPISLILTACQDFLEETPETAIPEADAMRDLSSAEEVCIGIYSSFKNPSLYSGTLVQAAEVQADLFYAAKGYTNRFGDFYRWEVNANESSLLDVYGGLYQIVSRCNFFLDHEAEVRGTLTSKDDIKLMDKYTADVCFMRAYAYSDLVRLFCEAYDPATSSQQMGVPLYLHYRQGNGAVEILPRASLEDCYQQILSDLERAEKLEPRKGCDTPFITQGAVLALKARVLLYMQRWEEAEQASTDVIEQKNGNGLTYSLADAFYDVITPDGTVSNEYDCMWQYDTADEIIWKIYFSTTDQGGSLGSLFMGITSGRYNPNYLPANWLLNAYQQGDWRYSAFFALVTTMQGLRWEAMVKFPGNPQIDGTAGVYYCNMPKLLRLSETYLIRAEARCMQGKIKLASDDLTQLRRARIKNYGSALYNTQEELLAGIQDERAKELVGEGFRLSDLKRWGLGFERTPQAGTIDGSSYNALKVPAGSSRYVWLLPEHEISASKGVVKQNPQ